ncbi:phosphatase PAP2 family protein [Chitinibacter sp. FCG-7]|uniref:Phosphatase PAP2 family protein n=1 Tax=Chitinibacter mangrovi TaxID=3153927 RepID=A0AAU7F7U6_9NEIS
MTALYPLRRLIASASTALACWLLLQHYATLAHLDALLGQWAYAHSDASVQLSRWLSQIGGGVGCVLLILAASALIGRQYRDMRGVAFLVAAGVGSWLLNSLLKNHYERSRPAWEHLVYASGYSLPSGHAMAALTLSCALALIMSRHWPQRRWLWWVLAASWTMAAGAARLVLGVHYFTDVIAGYLLASSLLCALSLIYQPATRRLPQA